MPDCGRRLSNCCEWGNSPPWQRRGGRDINKWREATFVGRTGWFVQPPNRSARRLNEPPRPHRQPAAATRPPLLCQGGECADHFSTHWAHEGVVLRNLFAFNKRGKTSHFHRRFRLTWTAMGFEEEWQHRLC